MKICFIGNSTNAHVERWCFAFRDLGYEIYILTFDEKKLDGIKTITIPKLFFERNKRSPKFSYIFKYFWFKREMRNINPDIIHAHFAMGNGAIAALSNLHPLIISTWGSEVFDTTKYLIYRKFLEFNLKRADYITATSEILKVETEKYTNKRVCKIAFGVDTNKFGVPRNEDRKVITVGIIKTLTEKYGIKYLIEAFKMIIDNGFDCRLLIVGEGNQEQYLKALCDKYDINNRVEFAGRIEHRDVPKYLARMDIFVVPSILDSETFGVSAIEASASGIPVIASRVGGLPEVIIDGQTGYLVEAKNSKQIAERLEKLIKNPKLRIIMGKRGKEFVKLNYEWRKNVHEMNTLYQNIVKNKF